VDDWLGDRVRELGRWSASFVLFEGVPGLRAPRRSGDLVRRDLTAFLDSLLEHNAVYESLLVADPGGEVLVGTRAESLEPPVRAVLRDLPPGTGRIGPLFRSEALGRPTLLSAYSILDRQLGTVGALVGRIDIRQLEARLQPPREEPDLAFVLLDAESRILIRSGRTLASPGRDAFPVAIGGESTRGGVSSVPAGILGAEEGALLLAVRPLEGPLPGYIVATLPETVAYGALDASRRNLLAAGLPLARYSARSAASPKAPGG
jgi:hypothetical protein